MSKCLNCSVEFEPYNTGKLNEKKFCSETCRVRFNAVKSYYKHKDEPDYKLKKRNYFREWIKKNKEKYNASVREANKRHQIKVRAFRKENNLCVYCRKPKELNKSLCDKCMSKRRKNGMRKM